MDSNLANIYIVLIFIILSSCNKDIQNKNDLLSYMSENDKGLVKKNHANGYTFSFKFLPPQYLAMNEIEFSSSFNADTYNNHLAEFSGYRTFLFSITPEPSQVSATEYGIESLNEYKKRIEDLQFSMKDHIYLETDIGSKIKPILSSMENLYEAKETLTFYLVFADKDEEVLRSETLDIVFLDKFLETGINHFKFHRDDLDGIPDVIFENH